MSAALNRAADTSLQSNGTQLDLSLGSFVSGFSTPGRPLRQVSGSLAASMGPLATPSPPTAAQFTRRRLDEQTPMLTRRRSGLDDHDDGDGADVLDTPGREKKYSEAMEMASPGRPTRTRSAGGKGGPINLTLRDQEKVCVFQYPRQSSAIVWRTC